MFSTTSTTLQIRASDFQVKNNFHDESWERFSNITDLIIRGDVSKFDCGFSDDKMMLSATQIQILCQWLEINNHIKQLNLDSNKIHKNSTPHLVSMINNNKGLEELNLSSCEINNECLISLCVAIQNNSYINKINFSNNNLNCPDAVNALINLIKTNKIVSLNLSSCSFSEESLQLLVQAVSENTSLIYLDLSMSNIKCVNVLVNMIKNNKTVESLGLPSCKDIMPVLLAVIDNPRITDLKGYQYNCSATRNDIIKKIMIAKKTNDIELLQNTVRAGFLAWYENSNRIYDFPISKILDESILPSHSSFAQLKNELITIRGKIEKTMVVSNSLVNSLAKSWSENESRQKDWEHYKIASIDLGKKYFEKNVKHPDVICLYALLANCRKIIGDILEQNTPQLGHALQINKNFICNKTYIAKKGRYADFYDDLSQKLNKLGSLHEIIVEGLVVTKLTQLDEKIEITHCEPTTQNYLPLKERIRKEFNEYHVCEQEELIWEKIAKLVYYFTVAEPLERGGAATTEMTSQVLLQHKGIFAKYTGKISMDLVAFFATNIDEFVQYFKQAHQLHNNTNISDYCNIIESYAFDYAFIDRVKGLYSVDVSLPVISNRGISFKMILNNEDKNGHLFFNFLKEACHAELRNYNKNNYEVIIDVEMDLLLDLLKFNEHEKLLIQKNKIFGEGYQPSLFQNFNNNVDTDYQNSAASEMGCINSCVLL